MRDVADVDLRREVTQDRRLQGLVGGERSAGQRPGAPERLAPALPEQHLELPVADLEDDGEHAVRRSGGGVLAV